MINGKLDRQVIRKTRIKQPYDIPPQLAVNIVYFPFEKQIKDGRTYNPIKLF